MKRPGRNDPCFCGSGKKYKQCCMESELATEQAPPAIGTAISLHQQGRIKEAQGMYEAILQNEPNHPEALHFLGVIAYQEKNFPAAEELMRRAIALNPSSAIYQCNFGMLLRDSGKFAEAVEHHRKALALKPDYAEAYLNLGVALFHLDQWDDAEHTLQKAIQLQPNSVKAHDNLATVLRCLYDYAGAIEHSMRAIELDSTYVNAYTNLAATYLEVKNLPMASSYALKAIELDGTNPDAFLYLGIACQEQENFVDAERFFLYATELDPNNKNVLWNLCLTRIGMGKLSLGWRDYEYRWTRETGPIKPHVFPYPWWQGEAMLDKTILVWGEQGIGDEIMFANMFEDLIPLFKHCIFACNKKLIPLFARSFPGATIIDVANKELIAKLQIDVQSASGSLARWLRPTQDSFPKKEHYISPNAERVAYWKSRLDGLGSELKIGISWRSGNLTGNRLLYCTLLEQWGPLFNVPGVRFINLQYDDCAEELKKAHQDFGVNIQSFNEVDLFNDLDETAALTKALDLVISAPTSAAILAAAMGVPTWMMVSGFNWQKMGTPEMVWYSTVRLLEKRWDQKWDVVIDEAAELLEKTKP